MNFSQNTAIINLGDETFGVVFTNLGWKRASWSLQWTDVIAIDAMQVEPAFIGLGFITGENQWKFASEDMKNWSALEQVIRERYPEFNWKNFDRAKNFIETRFPCWRRTT